jgi:hypothetical protein
MKGEKIMGKEEKSPCKAFGPREPLLPSGLFEKKIWKKKKKA